MMSGFIYARYFKEIGRVEKGSPEYTTLQGITKLGSSACPIISEPDTVSA
jgi:hypothetical protein